MVYRSSFRQWQLKLVRKEWGILLMLVKVVVLRILLHMGVHVMAIITLIIIYKRPVYTI